MVTKALKLLVVLMSIFVLALNAQAMTLKLFDFDSGRINDFGGSMGAWNVDPADTTQGCFEALDSDIKRGSEGASLRLEYDVDSANPAYNGFWTKLEGRDLSDYNAISFWVKGDSDAGYTTRFKIELKNAEGEVGTYIVSGVTDEWTEVVAPFSDFRGIKNFDNMTEWVIVFDDVMTTAKEGIIYVDDVAFETQ